MKGECKKGLHDDHKLLHLGDKRKVALNYRVYMIIYLLEDGGMNSVIHVWNAATKIEVYLLTDWVKEIETASNKGHLVQFQSDVLDTKGYTLTVSPLIMMMN